MSYYHNCLPPSNICSVWSGLPVAHKRTGSHLLIINLVSVYYIGKNPLFPWKMERKKGFEGTKSYSVAASFSLGSWVTIYSIKPSIFVSLMPTCLNCRIRFTISFPVTFLTYFLHCTVSLDIFIISIIDCDVKTFSIIIKAAFITTSGFSFISIWHLLFLW